MASRVVVTRSTCFLCLKEQVPGVTRESEKVPMVICNLGKVFRYINLEGAAGMLQNKKGGSGDKDLKVVLCQDCAEVTEKLTKLVEELEVVQLKVNYGLREFQSRFQDHCERPGRLDEKGGLLREKTIEKCALKLDSCSVVKSEPTPEDALDLEEHQNLLKSFKLPLMKDVPQTVTANNLVMCGLCPVEAQSVYGRDILFLRHVSCCHLDYLFGSLKLTRFTEEQFKSYCEHLLEQEMRLSGYIGDRLKKRNADANPAYNCHLCGDIFHEVKGILTHLVSSHSEHLAMKLLELQTDQSVDLEEIVNQPRSDVFSLEGPKYNCDNCGRVFANFSSIVRHRKQPCEWKPMVEKSYECDHCGLKFKSINGKQSHVKRIHFGIDHNRDRTRCELCGKTMSKSSLGRHKHYSCPVRMGKRPKLGNVRSLAPAQVQEKNVRKQKIEVRVGVGTSEVRKSATGSKRKTLASENQQDLFFINEDLSVEEVEEEEESEEEYSYESPHVKMEPGDQDFYDETGENDIIDS